MALGPGKLTLAALALLLTSAGWWVIGGLFAGSSDPGVQALRANNHWPWHEDSLTQTDFEEQFDFHRPRNNIVLYTAVYFVRPGLELFGSSTQVSDTGSASMSTLAFLLVALRTVWMILVWTVLGGAIARIAVVEFTQDRRVSMIQALRYAIARWRAFVGAPGVMLVGILMASIPIMLIGLIAYPGGFMYALAGFVWPVALLFGLIMAILALGLLFGWPLMAVAVAAEREEDADSFGAISRAFEYGYQHIFKYLLYIMFTMIIGGVAWLVVTLVAAQVLELTGWAASWGAPEGTISNEMVSISKLEYQRTSGDISLVGSFLIRCWTGVIQTTVVAFAFTFFWSAASGIYVLLRHHAEGVSLSEVYLPEPEEPGLPPFERDPAGVPVVRHEMPVSDDVPAPDAPEANPAPPDADD